MSARRRERGTIGRWFRLLEFPALCAIVIGLIIACADDYEKYEATGIPFGLDLTLKPRLVHTSGQAASCVGTPALPHSFETADDGWTLTGFSRGTFVSTGTTDCGTGPSKVTYNGDPGAGPTGGGSSGCGTVLGGNYAAGTSYALTSPTFNCSKLKNVRLQYQRWANMESSIYDPAPVEIANDGATWNEVWKNNIATDVPTRDAAWKSQSLPVGDTADGKLTVQVRYKLTSDSSCQVSGWNIDRVDLAGIDPPPGAPSNVAANDTAGDLGGSISLTWAKSADDGAGYNDVVGYEVWRSSQTDSDKFSPCTADVADADGCGCVKGSTAGCANAGILSPGSTSYTDTSSITNLTSYWYQIRARDGAGAANDETSFQSNEVQARNNTGAPSTPTLVSPADGSASTDRTPLLKWDVPSDPNGDALHFKAEMSASASFSTATFTEEFSTTAKRDGAATTADWNITQGIALLPVVKGTATESYGTAAFVLMLGYDSNYSQSFTPGSTYQVHSIDVTLTTNNPSDQQYKVLVELRTANADGSPTTTVLATSSTKSGTLPGNPTCCPNRVTPNFTFAAPLPTVNSGTTYAIVVRGLNSNNMRILEGGNGSGHGGRYWNTSDGGGSWAENAAADLNFSLYQASYTTSTVAQSISVGSGASDIAQATLTATQTLNGQTISYEMSANGGANWEAATSGSPLNFTNPGNDLRWRATLTGTATVSPYIERVEISYTTNFVRESRYSSTGFSPSMPTACCSGMATYVVQAGDALNDGNYYWRISATDGYDYSVPSAARAFTVDTTAPTWDGAVTVTALDATTGGRLDVSWNQTATDALSTVSYNVYRGPTGFTASASNLITNVSTTSYADTGLQNATQYCYIVAPKDSVGNLGTASSQGCGTPSLTGKTAFYSQNFDAGNGSWTSSGVWAWGTTPSNGPSACDGGGSCWGTDLTANVPANTEVYLTSPQISGSGYSNIDFTFNMYLDTAFAAGKDRGFAQVQVSDAGCSPPSWLDIDGNTSFTDAVTNIAPAYLASCNVLAEHCYEDDRITWTPVTVSNLPAAFNNQPDLCFQLKYKTDGNASTAPGWFVDTVTVRGEDLSGPTFAGSFTATNAGTGGKIDLAWAAASDPSTPITYRLHRSTSAGFTADTSNEIAATTSTSYSDTGLTNGTTYYYRARAVDGLGNLTLHATEASAAPSAPPDTTAPTFTGIGLAEGTGTTGQAKVEFDAATDNTPPIKYNVYYATTANWGTCGWTATSPCVKVANCTTSAGAIYAFKCTVTGLTDGTQYTFGVRAEDSAGTPNQDSNTVTATAVPTAGTDNTAPTWSAGCAPSPSGITATNTAKGGEVSLEFNAATDPPHNSTPVKYNVYYKASACPVDFPTATVIPNVSVSAGSSCANKVTVAGLTNAAAYAFTVRAQDSSAQNNEDTNTVCASATPSDTTGPTFAGIKLAQLTGATGEVGVEWNAASDNSPPIKYDVYYATSANWGTCGWTATSPCVKLTNVTTTTGQTYTYRYLVTALTDGTQYTFGVRSVDSAATPNGESNTVTLTATPNTATPTPTLRLAAASDPAPSAANMGSGDKLTLEFDEATNAYVVTAANIGTVLPIAGKSWPGLTSATWYTKSDGACTAAAANCYKLVIIFSDGTCSPNPCPAPADILSPIGANTIEAAVGGADALVAASLKISGSFSAEVRSIGAVRGSLQAFGADVWTQCSSSVSDYDIDGAGFLGTFVLSREGAADAGDSIYAINTTGTALTGSAALDTLCGGTCGDGVGTAWHYTQDWGSNTCADESWPDPSPEKEWYWFGTSTGQLVGATYNGSTFTLESWYPFTGSAPCKGVDPGTFNKITTGVQGDNEMIYFGAQTGAAVDYVCSVCYRSDGPNYCNSSQCGAFTAPKIYECVNADTNPPTPDSTAVQYNASATDLRVYVGRSAANGVAEYKIETTGLTNPQNKSIGAGYSVYGLPYFSILNNTFYVLTGATGAGNLEVFNRTTFVNNASFPYAIGAESRGLEPWRAYGGIFFGDESGNLHCVVESTGAACAGFPIQPDGTNPIRTQPIVNKGVLYFSNTVGKVFAYDITTNCCTLKSPVQLTTNGYPYNLGVNLAGSLVPNRDFTFIVMGGVGGNVWYLPMEATDPTP